MSVRYCGKCRKAMGEGDTVFFKGYYFCLKCRKPTSSLGEERGRISRVAAGLRERGELLDSEAGLSGNVKTYSKSSGEPVVIQCLDVLKHDPDNVDAHFALARFYYGSGESNAFNQHFNAVKDLDPEHEGLALLVKEIEYVKETEARVKDHAAMYEIKVLSGLAERLLGEGKPLAAKVHLEKILGLDSQHERALEALSEIYMEAEDYGEAIRVLSVLKAVRPGDVFIVYNIGVAAMVSGDLHRARDCFEAVVAWDGVEDELREASLGYLRDVKD